MPTPAEIIKMVSSLQNDTKQSVYKPGTVLPYFNMALNDLQEEFELNDIPVTEDTTAALTVPASTTAIAFSGTTPVLPANLIEIKQLWESDTGQEIWIPMVKRDFLPHYREGVQVTRFGIWSWLSNEIRLLSSLQINDLKIDYLKSIFTEVTVDTLDTELGVKFKNIKSYLGYATSALCSAFIGEDPERAIASKSLADRALSKSMGISIKGKQSILTRRRPFRSGYKMRSRIF